MEDVRSVQHSNAVQCSGRTLRARREIEEIFNVNFMFAHKFEFYNLTAKKGDRFMHIHSAHTRGATTLAGAFAFSDSNALDSSKWKRLVAVECQSRIFM